jgi:hypothetical protein
MSSQSAVAGTMSLAELQREMAAAIMMPLTPDEEMQPNAPDGRPMSEVAERFIAPNSRLAAFERLEIYNRQYWFRLLTALAEDFPALRAVVGASAFERLAIDYLSAHPSRSFSLRNLGSKLPEWLATHPQHTGRRQRLALDVVNIEWAFIETFDNSRLGLQPHLQLLALEYAADELVLALHQKQRRGTSEAGVKHEDESETDHDPDKPAPLPRLRRKLTWVAAHRLDDAVYFARLEREEFLTLKALGAGRPLGEALEAGFRESARPDARRPKLVQSWFSRWGLLGWICAPELESLLQE